MTIMEITSRSKVPELIYGTIIMVAIVGAFAELGAPTPEIVATLVGSSVALWLAHAYSRAIAAQLERRRYLRPSEVWEVMKDQASVVAVVPLPLTLILLAEAGLFSTSTALRLSVWAGIAILFVAGASVAHQATESRAWILLGGLANASLGVVVILLEAFFAH